MRKKRKMLSLLLSAVCGYLLVSSPVFAWDYCFQDVNYSTQYQMSLTAGDKVIGQIMYPTPTESYGALTGKYYASVGLIIFSIDYIDNAGHRFYEWNFNSMDAETWAVYSGTGEFYDTPHMTTFTPCTTTTEGDLLQPGETGAVP